MEERIDFIVDEENSGIRLDKCLALRLGEAYSRTYAKNLMDKGLVTVNGVGEKASYQTRRGDRVSAILPPPESSDIQPEDIPLQVIYEDEWLMVVDKPAGMVVHPGCGNKTGTMAGAVLYHLKGERVPGDPSRPGIVHRLDKETSGLVVVAKDDRAMRSLARQFQKRCVKKVYAALVEGSVQFDNGIVDVPIARHERDRKKMSVAEDEGKTAKTVYHVVRRFRKFTFLRLELHTGRTHQIRVHMKHIGHPVLGDKTYGRAAGFKRQMLHAEQLGFTHPDTAEYMEFHSPLPGDIMDVISKGEHELEDKARQKDKRRT